MRLLAALATLLLGLGFATEASAHAALVSVAPASGSVLASAPMTVELRFNEPVTPGVIRLIDGAGRARDDAIVTASGETLSVAMPGDLPQGTAVVSYRVISQDGHPVAGSVIFSIGAPTAAQADANANDIRLRALIWLARVGLYLGLFVGVGGAVFARWISWSMVGATIPRAALAVGLPSAVVSLGALGLDLFDLPLSALLTAAPWKIAVATSAGASLLVAMAAMVLASWALRTTRSARAATAIAFVAVGVSLAMSGHAATAAPELVMRPAVFLHALGVTFWVGALAPLIVVMSRSTPALPVLNRFSRIAMPVVGVLVLTGLALAAVQLERGSAVIDTSYGIILFIKLALVACLLLLAARNRFRLTPDLAGGVEAAPALRRAIILECVLAVAILAVVAGWRFTPPPRTLVPDTPLALHIHTDKAMVQLLMSPARPGPNDVSLDLMTGDGAVLAAKEVTLTLSLPARGIEPMEIAARAGADGAWRAGKVMLPVAGRWHLKVDALVSDFETVTLEDEFDLKPALTRVQAGSEAGGKMTGIPTP